MTFFDDMISEALSKIDKDISVYTFAFYHDHESSSVSICIDTEEKSKKLINHSNEFNRKYFKTELDNNNLEALKLWNFQTGRSFSLDDYQLSNIIYKEIPEELRKGTQKYLEMIKAIERNKDTILKYSKNPEDVFFCCSSENEEVEYVWK